MDELLIYSLPGRIKDISGQRFDKLVAVIFSHSAYRRSFWWFRCDCGNYALMPNDGLGLIRKSCGCHGRRMLIEKRFQNQTHGFGHTRLGSIYYAIKLRCCNPETENYRHYGGRGITLCEEWRDSPEAFFAWALANEYDDSLQIDRRDNDCGYNPGNCWWTTRKRNQNNRRNTRFLTLNGETRALSDWADFAGLKYHTLSNRLRAGWSLEDALAKPPKATSPSKDISPPCGSRQEACGLPVVKATATRLRAGSPQNASHSG